MQSISLRCAILGASFFLSSVRLALAEPPPTPPPIPTAPPLRSPSPGANPDEFPVVISYPEGQRAQARINRDLMDPVGMLPNQIVTVTLFFPPSRAGQPVEFGLYDGGQIGAPGLRLPAQEMFTLSGIPVVSVDGTVQFNFKSGGILGLYRLLVAVGPSQYLVQFYAVKPVTGN